MIVGLCGKKGAGKDAAGQYLVENHGFTRLSFADPLKDSAAACWPGVTKDDWNEWKNDSHVHVQIIQEHQGVDMVVASVTAREFLQRYGTEAHRDVFGQNFWINFMEEQLSLGAEPRYVITDARFENEILLLKKYGGTIIYLDRPGMDMADQHASETSVPEELIDVTIPNNSTLEALYSRMDLLAAGATVPNSL